MRTIRVSVLVLAVLTVGALSSTIAWGQAEKLLPVDGVNFAVGSVDGVFIPGTTSAPTTEEAVVPLSFRGIVGSAPDSVKVIVLEVTYPVDQLTYLGGSLDAFGEIAPEDVFWNGDSLFAEEDGVITVILDSDTVAPPEAFTEFCYLRFEPLCQDSGAAAHVTVRTGPGESYVSYQDIHYTDPTDPEPYGTVTVADYEGYVSVLDDDPFDEDPRIMSLQGVVGAGAVIDVPVYLSTNANVFRLQGLLSYDETRFMPTGYTLGDDGNPWVWTYGSEPNYTPGFVYIDVVNYPFSDNDAGEPCTVVTVQLTVLDDWRGQTEELAFVPYGQGIHVGNDHGSVCEPLAAGFTYHSGFVAMEEYAATVALELDDMIYPADVGTNKVFTAVLAASHNFTIGGDSGADDPYQSALRLDLDLALDMNILNLQQPGPLGDFWFNYNVAAAKSPQQKIEFYSCSRDGIAGERGPTAELTPLVSMVLLQQNIVAPADFEAPGFPFVQQCLFGDRPARLRDAITGDLEVNCAEGLTLVAPPVLAYANGELTCDQRTSTRPASVVQDYYVRSTFNLTEFRVTVQKSGPHGILDVNPAAGVMVTDQGSDYVTFEAAPGWQPAAYDERHGLGSITYNTTAAIEAHEFDKAGIADKDIGPPIRWCWQWTTISFGTDSYLHDATGQETFLFTTANRVGTRYDCSFTDPIDNPAVAAKSLPSVFALEGNHPNPFNPQTTISFDLPRETMVEIVIHDLQGRRVAVLVHDVRSAGRHEVIWTGRDQSGRAVASGTYFYVMRAGDFTERQKMVLLK